ncbi:hypothetical protein [Microlunatus aurantiacus]|uniref:hypothetical protein n=1 Tax=Microlunatus aurantiacus TaxID=446786 RepID=UPI003CD0B79E
MAGTVSAVMAGAGAAVGSWSGLTTGGPAWRVAARRRRRGAGAPVSGACSVADGAVGLSFVSGS